VIFISLSIISMRNTPSKNTIQESSSYNSIKTMTG
jgi:hypothetical protein